MILLPDTDLSGAHAFAERMFVSLEDFASRRCSSWQKEMEFIQEADAPCTLTVSMGVAVQEMDGSPRYADPAIRRAVAPIEVRCKDRYLIDMILPS